MTGSQLNLLPLSSRAITMTGIHDALQAAPGINFSEFEIMLVIPVRLALADKRSADYWCVAQFVLSVFGCFGHVVGSVSMLLVLLWLALVGCCGHFVGSAVFAFQAVFLFCLKMSAFPAVSVCGLWIACSVLFCFIVAVVSVFACFRKAGPALDSLDFLPGPAANPALQGLRGLAREYCRRIPLQEQWVLLLGDSAPGMRFDYSFPFLFVLVACIVQLPSSLE